MKLIFTFTDFGVEGPYLGQMIAVLYRQASACRVVNLCANIPPFDVQVAAYLLAAYTHDQPTDSLFLCVVDPGVGSERRPLILEVDGCLFIGPDNGLFAIVARRAQQVAWWQIDWRPTVQSVSFHGRDLFAPVAAALAEGREIARSSIEPSVIGMDWPDDLARIIYLDRYGNAVTGLRAANLPPGKGLGIGDIVLPWARVYADVPVGQPFCFANSNGLLEIAVNQGHAGEVLGLTHGMEVVWLTHD